ncbi:MAG: Gfo/Idh/MocA family oxidoreductase [Planctomycetes bacterium]|nr:Gfo/Idh/MocA family oxidoreductase [Planctomycetota bacterium]
MSRDASPVQPSPATPPEDARPSRREFLGNAAALAAAAAALASCRSVPAIGAAAGPIPRHAPRTPLAPGEPVLMGVIGTGGMGDAHCVSFMNLNAEGRANVRIAALCDVNRKRLASTHRGCEEKQGAKVDVHRDYRELLARSDLHGVLIAAPEHWHAQMAIDALAAGKDVYVEKPMTLRLPEALRLRQVVLANPDMIFQVGTQKMILPKWGAAKKLIAEDVIGKPTFSQTSYCRNSKDGEWLYYTIDPEVVPGENLDWEGWCGPLGPQPFDGAVLAQWRRYRKFSTGIVGDLLVHQMTPLMMALDAGWPTRVTASGGHYVDQKMENHDQVNMTIEFERGHTMIVAGSTCNEVGIEVMIRGHKATLYLNGRDCVLRPERIYADEIEEQTVACADIGDDQDALRVNWLDSIRSREPAVSGIDLASKMMVAVDLATRSMWEGHAYVFDPTTMTARQA